MIKPGSRGAGVAVLGAAALLLLASPSHGQDGGGGKGEAVVAGPTSGTVTFDVRDQPVDEVLNYLRRAAPDVNIITAPEAEAERVTLAVRNMEWRLALEEIAKRTGCTVEEISPSFLRVEKPPRVSFSFEQADIAKVIRTIAALSGANIVSDPEDVKGMVTVNLIDTPWRKALEAIVGTKGFRVVEESGGILRVVSPGKLQQELETEIYKLKFLRPPPMYTPKLPASEYVEKSGTTVAGDIEKTFNIIVSLREALKPEGTLEYIGSSNAFVLKGTKPKLAQVKRMLDALDREPMQIFVDMQFISTQNRDFFEIGLGPGEQGLGGSMTLARVEGGVHLPFNTGEGGFEDHLLIKGDLPKVGPVSPAFSFGNLDFSTSSYILRMLRNDIRSRIVQAPKLFVLDNQEATIFVGESIRFAQTEASSSQAGTLQFSIKEAGGSPVSVGFQLLLIPHVIPDTDKVMMTLVPSQKSLSGTSTELPGFDRFSVGGGTAEQTIFLPRESSSTLITTLVVEHGTTAVLGGLMQDTNAETVQKVPFLGDLPLVGWLFKTEQKSKQKSQLMIFLTPWLVKDSASQRQAIQSDLLRRERGLDEEWERLSGGMEPVPVMPAGEMEEAPAPKTPSGPK